MLDLEIDKLTNSIENAVTHEVYQTKIQLLQRSEIKVLRKKDWIFDWKKEHSNSPKLIYKLIASVSPQIIHGLLSISINQDHVFMHLIENAKINKGKEKHFLGVAGNLIAYACKLSFEKGFDGIVVFESKTTLISYYQLSIGAKILTGNRMFIDSKEAHSLVNQYFK